MRLYNLLIFILLSSCLIKNGSDNQLQNIENDKVLFIAVKYIPFSLRTRAPLVEKHLDEMESSIGMQVKKDTIFSNSISSEIISKLNKIKKSSNDYYSLRIKCTIKFSNNIEKIFYADPRKDQLIIDGEVYDDTEGIITLIIENICRPYFHNFYSENRFWSNNDTDCGDSLEFRKYYPTIDYELLSDSIYQKYFLGK